MAPSSDNNVSSPLKRPGLGRRALSSHVITAGAGSSIDLSDPSSASNIPNPSKPHHRPHRAHVVGLGHRSHGRNPSLGKILTKNQRLTSAHQLGTERNHHRKKSAPVTPGASSDGITHRVRWDGLVSESGSSTNKNGSTSVKKNYSSPSLQRNSSGVAAKAGLVAERPLSSPGKKKKTVGFELAGSDNEDGEWEDATQSPESTRRSSRRSSVVQVKSSVDNTTVLVDPLTFVKRPFPQAPRAASLPGPNSYLHQDHILAGGESTRRREDSQTLEREPGHGGTATRLLSPARLAKAPPTMSSISATARPGILDSYSRNTALANLTPSQTSVRRSPPTSTPALVNISSSQTQSASPSTEGRPSKPIADNKSAMYSSPRTDSNANTQSSFLPYYHPQTPPSPKNTPKKPGMEPPSRTQQKLWLQRTATLSTVPPDSQASAVSPSVMDPALMAAVHSRPGAYDARRSPMMNGSSITSSASHGGESKHIRKAYEKTAMELAVVRQFQSPTEDSFSRLRLLLGDTKAATERGRPSSLSKSFKSAPSLTLLRDSGQRDRSQPIVGPESKQLMSRRTSDSKDLASQTSGSDSISLTTSRLPHRFKSQPPSSPILSTSEETSYRHAPDDEHLEDESSYLTSAHMMMRRMWESREVATSG